MTTEAAGGGAAVMPEKSGHDADKVPEGKIPLLIEAAMAFGTGHHGTTLGCLRAFDQLLDDGVRPQNVVDIGCGTAVLAMAACSPPSTATGPQDAEPAAETANVETPMIAPWGYPMDAFDPATKPGDDFFRQHGDANAAARDHVETVTEVTFAPLTVAQIRHYCQSGEPLGKAGAYAIQGAAAGFVAELSGSLTGVIGLPVVETLALLARFEVEPHLA